jgi:hypothetical protein
MLLLAANAAATQPAAQSHEQHQASVQHQAAGPEGRCCCEEMMRKMMSQMMQKQGMGMSQSKADQPSAAPDEQQHKQ